MTLDPQATAALKTMQAAITVLADLEGQDHTLVLEMAQDMLNDILNHEGQLSFSLDFYVRRYCDLLDGPDDVAPIVASIETEAAAL